MRPVSPLGTHQTSPVTMYGTATEHLNGRPERNTGKFELLWKESARLCLLGYLAWLVRQQPRPPVPEVILDDVQVFHQHPSLGPPLLVILLLCPGLPRWFGQVIRCLGHGIVRPRLNKFILYIPLYQRLYTQEVAVKPGAEKSTYVSEHDTSLLEDLWLVVVVDVELREQNLVLVR